MPLEPPILGGFDVVEFLGAMRTPASLLKTSKDGCPVCPRVGVTEGNLFPPHPYPLLLPGGEACLFSCFYCRG